MKLAIEWFLNPDHLPFIVAQHKKIFHDFSIHDFELIEPEGHYDGLSELLDGKIDYAVNEPLHLVEQFDPRLVSLGIFFKTRGGVMFKSASYEKLKAGQTIRLATPVSNERTNAIALEIIRRYASKEAIRVEEKQVVFVEKDFYLINHLKGDFDAAWLIFDNFEGVESRHEKLEVVSMDHISAGFPNFCALDIFTTKSNLEKGREQSRNLLGALGQAISFIKTSPDEAMELYYKHTAEKKSDLMDDIIRSTIKCFPEQIASSFEQQAPLLEFFRDIGITR